MGKDLKKKKKKKKGEKKKRNKNEKVNVKSIRRRNKKMRNYAWKESVGMKISGQRERITGIN